MAQNKKLYGAETEKAVQNFPVSGKRLSLSFISALALVKCASAVSNSELKIVDPKTAKAIASAALSIASGKYQDQFVVDVFQTGSGTSTNMNMNEVISRLAGKKIHPNDDVNRGQSSND